MTTCDKCDSDERDDGDDRDDSDNDADRDFSAVVPSVIARRTSSDVAISCHFEIPTLRSE